jgi:hypothetical protein
VVAKSPLTGMLTDALASSQFAIAGKLTGHDAIVIRGRSERLSVLLVDGDGTRLQDASHLAGMTAADADSKLRDQLGRGWRVAAIGPADEIGVRYATISHDGRHAGRGGLGAVMGAKNLKAIAVRAAAKVATADPGAVLAAARDLRARSFGPATEKYRELGTLANLLAFNAITALPTRNFQAATFDGASRLAGEPATGAATSEGEPESIEGMRRVARSIASGRLSTSSTSAGNTFTARTVTLANGSVANCPVSNLAAVYNNWTSSLVRAYATTPAAVTAWLLTAATDNTSSSSSSRVTSVTTTSGADLLILIYRQGSSASMGVSSVSGSAISGTPALVNSEVFSSSPTRELWAYGAAGSGTAGGTVTVTFTDADNVTTTIDVVQLSNVGSPVVQSAVTAGSSTAATGAALTGVESGGGEIFFAGLADQDHHEHTERVLGPRRTRHRLLRGAWCLVQHLRILDRDHHDPRHQQRIRDDRNRRVLKNLSQRRCRRQRGCPGRWSGWARWSLMGSLRRADFEADAGQVAEGVVRILEELVQESFLERQFVRAVVGPHFWRRWV